MVYISASQIYNFGMKNFHDFYFGMTGPEREAYVKRVGTSIGYTERIAGGFALPSLRSAVKFARHSKGKTSLDGIVKTYESKNGPLSE